jgi:type II secretory pathway pseudopilin PulG
MSIQSPQRLSPGERGFALLDLIFVCGVIGILASIAMPRLLLARQAAGAASAIGSLRAVNSAQLSYAFTCGSGFYAPSLTVLGTTPPGGGEAFITPSLGGADVVTHSGYVLQMTGTPYAGAPASCNGLGIGEGAQGFKAAVDPVEAINTRYFATNANMTILEDVATLWDDIPESGESAVGHLIQ